VSCCNFNYFFRRKTLEQAQEITEAREYRSFNRAIGTWELLLLFVGSLIGAGIFVLPGVAAAKYAGSGVSLSYLLGG